MFGKCSELEGGGSPASPLGGGSFNNVRKMFGIVGCLAPWMVAPPLCKSSEMFGNVRKMFGTGVAAPPTFPR